MADTKTIPAPAPATAPAPKVDQVDKALAAETKLAEEAALEAETAELEEAQRIAENSEPIECICIKKFFDERGATVVPGERYFYTKKQNVPFPAELLEPTNKVLAKAALADYAGYQEEKEYERRRRDHARDTVLRALSGE